MSWRVYGRYSCTLKRISFCVFPRGTLAIFKSQQPKNLAENPKSAWNQTGEKASWSKGEKKPFAELCISPWCWGRRDRSGAAGSLRGQSQSWAGSLVPAGNHSPWHIAKPNTSWFIALHRALELSAVIKRSWCAICNKTIGTLLNFLELSYKY